MKTLLNQIRVLWWQFRETKDQAWSDGYQTAANDYDEVIEDKDTFIAEQSMIIEHCMKVFDMNEMWSRVPEPLIEQLRSYV